MRTFLSLLVLLVAALGAGGGYFYWRASQGVSASALEAAYATPADRFVDVDGARVRVREEGPAGAPPVLLVHGFTHSLETWDAWADDLKADYRVIRYDLLGHGLTGPDAQERYAPTQRAAFVGAVMDALAIERAVIVGNSLGGLAAWRFAAGAPDRVAALTLVAPGAFPFNGVGDEPAPIPAAVKAYLMTAPEAGVKASADVIYADDAKVTDARLETMRAMMRREGNGAAFVRSLEMFTLPDPVAALGAIQAPTLILWGEGDVLLPIDQAERVRDAIPGARLITYPGVGHAPQEEAPAKTLADFRAFLRDDAPADRQASAGDEGAL
ncbi:MAG: alpha/beta fold hydrolase [Pseudomonadota bacterium]